MITWYTYWTNWIRYESIHAGTLWLPYSCTDTQRALCCRLLTFLTSINVTLLTSIILVSVISIWTRALGEKVSIWGTRSTCLKIWTCPAYQSITTYTCEVRCRYLILSIRAHAWRCNLLSTTNTWQTWVRSSITGETVRITWLTRTILKNGIKPNWAITSSSQVRIDTLHTLSYSGIIKVAGIY